MALSSVRKASESAQGNTLAPTCANDIERKAMALVSITEAARLVGVSEKTIRRKIATGEVSAQVSGQGGQARKVLDTSELIRVFGSMPGQMPPPVQSDSPDMPVPVYTVSTHADGLEQVIKTQQTLIEVLQTQLEARTIETRELRSQVTGLLEWRKPTQEPPPVQPQVSSERIKLMVILAVLGCIGAAVLAWAAGYRI